MDFSAFVIDMFANCGSTKIQILVDQYLNGKPYGRSKTTVLRMRGFPQPRLHQQKLTKHSQAFFKKEGETPPSAHFRVVSCAARSRRLLVVLYPWMNLSQDTVAITQIQNKCYLENTQIPTSSDPIFINRRFKCIKQLYIKVYLQFQH